MKLLGIHIDKVNLEESRQKVRGFLTSVGQFKLFTPNPEMLVKAQKDEYFREVLNGGDLNLCDGFGVWLVARLSFPRKRESTVAKSQIPAFAGMTVRAGMTGKIERIAGVDFMLEICKIAGETGDSVFLLGSGDDEIIKKTADNLMKQFPKIKIAGFDKGPVVDENFQFPISNFQSINNGTTERRNNFSGLKIIIEDNESLIKKINQSEAAIVFVAFGMGKQEKWIHENLSKMPGVKIAMGVGGAFDYISGNVKRAPCWMRKIGLEWIYRLICEPRRIWRILNATAFFSFLVFKSKIKYQK